MANLSELTRERAQSFLTDDHIERIVKAYEQFKDEPGFTRVATLEEIRAKDANLSIPLYVAPVAAMAEAGEQMTVPGLAAALGGWLESSLEVRTALAALLEPAATAVNQTKI